MNSPATISHFQPSPIAQDVLPDGFIERIRAYKLILSEVETSSLEEAVSNFQRDFEPERELIIWERIALIYQEFITEHLVTSQEAKKDVLVVLLSSSMGAINYTTINHLTKEQIKEIAELYQNHQ